MGDTLGLIYPHGDFVQPNLPPPDFNKDLLTEAINDFNNRYRRYGKIEERLKK